VTIEFCRVAQGGGEIGADADVARMASLAQEAFPGDQKRQQALLVEAHAQAGDLCQRYKAVIEGLARLLLDDGTQDSPLPPEPIRRIAGAPRWSAWSRLEWWQ
jgi:hypothetical protein